ncbi:MAG: hypothetical protein M1827_005785 [Pycnora praestabilis]|nr:MAG: hypothetical protein M1827_005785 [Pycnora praestabilis]
MTLPEGPARAVQRPRMRATPVVPIIPAVPLSLVQKRKQIGIAAAKPVVNGGTSIAPLVNGSMELASPTLVNGSTEAAMAKLEDLGADISVAVEDENLEEPTPTPANLNVTVPETIKPPEIDMGHPEPAVPHPTYQMPPPFYPASHHSAPSSAGSSRFPHNPPHVNQPVLHHPHPSTGSLVFGGHTESSSPSPRLPHTSQSFPPQFPPSYAIDNLQQSANPMGHMHQSSDHHISMGYPHQPPNFYPRPDIYFPPGIGYSLPSGYYSRIPSFLPPEGQLPFSPAGTPVTYPPSHQFPQHDHLTPSSSQRSYTMSEPQEAEIVRTPDQSSERASLEVERPADEWSPPIEEETQLSKLIAARRKITTETPNPAQASISSASDDLLIFIQSLFGDEHADFKILFSNTEETSNHTSEHFCFGESQFMIHGLVASRSPTLKSLIQKEQLSSVGLRGKEDSNPAAGPRPQKRILLETADRFLRLDSFQLSLRYLYGFPLLEYDFFSTIPEADFLQDNLQVQAPTLSISERMEFALSYAAAGHLLQIPKVTGAGVQVALQLLNWDTVEAALAFAMDGDTASDAKFKDSVRSGSDLEYVNGITKINLSVPLNEDGPTPSEHVSTYTPHSVKLLQGVLMFVTRNFPPKFDLDRNVAPLPESDRLPTVPDARPSISNHRLSSIQFGDRPPEDAGRPSLETTILSRMLLGLRLPMLKYVLESAKLGDYNGGLSAGAKQQIAQNIIEEREKRRKRVFKSKIASNPQRDSRRKQWEVVGWEESVIGGATDRDQEFTLTRKWSGYTNPYINRRPKS